MEIDRHALEEWQRHQPLCILSLDPADRAVLRIAGRTLAWPTAASHLPLLRRMVTLLGQSLLKMSGLKLKVSFYCPRTVLGARKESQSQPVMSTLRIGENVHYSEFSQLTILRRTFFFPESH